jgi:peptidoglycan/LPS O-acetylase OafA/YrhL
LSQAELAVVHRQGWLWSYTANLFTARCRHWPFTAGRISLDPAWSLCIEEQFYLVWPALAYFLSRRSLTACCIAMIVIAPAIRWYQHVHGDPTLAFYVWTPCRMDGLAMGALLALVAEQGVWAERARTWALPILAVVALSVALTWNLPSRGEVYATSQMTIASAAVIVLTVTRGVRGMFSSVFIAFPLRFFGKYSYAIYLLHAFVLKDLCGRLLQVGPIQRIAAHSSLGLVAVTLLLGVVLSALAGYLSWHLFEKHFLKLKRLFAYRRSADVFSP